MAFTYVGDLSTSLDKVRFDLGDTSSGAGVMPDATNIPDATINAAVTARGSVGAASVWLCKRIAARWSMIASQKTMGGRSEANAQVDNFLKLADALAAEYGEASTGSFCIDSMRDDAYHDWNTLVEEDGSELTTDSVKYIRVS